MGQVLTPAGDRSLPRGSRRLLALRGDEYLVARIRSGDQVAFEVVYDRFAAPLLSFCRHMLGRSDDAEDAVQQVFVSAHAGLLDSGRTVALKPWLYAIARNRCLSIIRARRDVPDAHIEPACAGLQEATQGRADLRELLDDLSDLPEQQRAALLLTELDDLSHADAASVLQCEASQVKGLVFRARAGLIERRDARATPCAEIREELATARKGTLRKGRLKHHLKQCPGCSAYREEVRHQRRMMALILPVIPGAGLKRAVLAATVAGGGAGGAGGLTLMGTSMATATLAKLAAAGVLVAGAGIGGTEALDRREATPTGSPPSSAARPVFRTAPTRAASGSPLTARSASQPGARRATPGTPPKVARAKSHSRGGRPTSSRPAIPPGQIRRQTARSNGDAQANGNVGSQIQGEPGANSGRATKGGTRARGAPTPSPRAGPKKPTR